MIFVDDGSGPYQPRDVVKSLVIHLGQRRLGWSWHQESKIGSCGIERSSPDEMLGLGIGIPNDNRRLVQYSYGFAGPGGRRTGLDRLDDYERYNQQGDSQIYGWAMSFEKHPLDSLETGDGGNRSREPGSHDCNPSGHHLSMGWEGGAFGWSTFQRQLKFG